MAYPADVSPPTAKTFADRLRPVVEHEETDFSYLDEEMAAAVYPERAPRRFRIGLTFATFGGANYPRAVELARRAPFYRERCFSETSAEHDATFDADHAQDFLALYRILRDIPSVELRVNGRPLRGARKMWPLLFGILVPEIAWEPVE